jgi:diacylglycerol kinase family enzyme
LLGGDWTLGILPAGTSNDVARSLVLPLDPNGALGVVAAGHSAEIDVGIANGHVFLHAAAVGLNTDFAHQSGSLRRMVGRLSYPIAAIRVFRNRRTFHARINTATEERVSEALEVIVLNSPVFGGPLEMEAAALEMQDGNARVFIVADIDARRLVRALPQVMSRRVLRLPGIEAFSASSLRVTTEPPLPVTIDGEVKGWTPMNVEVKKCALRVFVPRGFGG